MTLMIVCVCRRLNSAAVKDAISCGARSPEAVQAHHGCQFNCGRCRTTIGEMIAEDMDQRQDGQQLIAAE
ncbi:MAG: (2Fe-2S)-binding protein [Pseudomonadota bacterium]